MENKISVVEKQTLSINKLFDTSKINNYEKVIEYASANSTITNASKWNRARLIYLASLYGDNKKAIALGKDFFDLNQSQVYDDILCGNLIDIDGKHSIFAKVTENGVFDFKFTAFAQISKIWKKKSNDYWKSLTKNEKAKTKGEENTKQDYIIKGIMTDLESGFITYDMDAKSIKDKYNNLLNDITEETEIEETATEETEIEETPTEKTIKNSILYQKAYTIFYNAVVKALNNNEDINAVIKYMQE